MFLDSSISKMGRQEGLHFICLVPSAPYGFKTNVHEAGPQRTEEVREASFVLVTC